MNGTLIALCALATILSGALWLLRRLELQRMAAVVGERETARRTGAAKAELQHPVVDLSRCLGCGTCVVACPEEDVLELVHGQAAVVNGAHCVGVAACARECPVGAISVTLADLGERRDVPALAPDLEAVGQPGLFLAGEVTAHALIKVAIEHGTRAVAAAAERARHAAADGVLDVCIVGAGPAGLAASLEAKRRGLSYVTLDQAAEPGGTVAKYPRRKLVLSQPVALPLVGTLPGTEFTKEELMALWRRVVADEALAIETDATVTALERSEAGWRIRTAERELRATSVVLALGRRGVPRKLGVPGEELSKVAYSLIDAGSFEQGDVLVVGGGDSAVETALGLAESGTNGVTLAYRQGDFFRIKKRNAERLERARASGAIEVLLRTEVESIGEREVVLQTAAGLRHVLPNDEVFVMIGGTPPFALLESAGVSFDPADRPAVALPEERGTGLTRAFAIGLGLCLVTLAIALWHSDYYLLPREARPGHPKHGLLRPGMGFGLWMGLAAVALLAVNLLYVARRSPRVRFRWGALETWMTGHIATGILAFLCASLHGALAPRDTVGGRAFWALAILLVTGAIGRYFYAWVPRSANGRERAIDGIKERIAAFRERCRERAANFANDLGVEVPRLMESRQWRGSFFGRALALFGVRFDLWRVQRRLRASALAAGLPTVEITEALELTRQAHRAALIAAHYEDLRAVLATWRYFHRWIAIGMLFLLLAHIVSALVYSAFWFEGVEA